MDIWKLPACDELTVNGTLSGQPRQAVAKHSLRARWDTICHDSNGRCAPQQIVHGRGRRMATSIRDVKRWPDVPGLAAFQNRAPRRGDV